MMIVLVITDLVNYSYTEQNLTEIKNSYLPKALSSSTMAYQIVNVQQFLTDVAATHESAGLADARTISENFKTELTYYRGHLKDDLTKQELDAIENTFDQFYKNGKRMAFSFIDNGIEASLSSKEDFDTASYRLTTQILKIRDKETTAIKKSVDEINLYTHEMRFVLLLLSAIVIVLAFIIAFLLTRHLGKQIGIDPTYAKGIAREIAKGDLSRTFF